MDNIALKAITRTTKGNSPARSLRRQGQVPAILYGPKSEPRMLAIQAFDIETIIKKGGLGRSVYTLNVDDEQNTKQVMIKELQTHPLSRAFLHVDLYEVAMDRKIYVNVPVLTVGESVGVDNGGVLQIIRHELEVFCLPNEIPSNFTIDITDLDIGDAVHVEDIPTSGNVEIPHDVNFTILTVSATRRDMDAAEVVEDEAVEDKEAGAE